VSPLKQYIIQDVISLVNIDVQVKDLEYETWKLRGRVQVLKFGIVKFSLPFQGEKQNKIKIFQLLQ